MIAFRCEGGDRVGAGHVARCLQIALAFRMSGAEPLFVGEFDGLAAALLEAEGIATAPPASGAPLGLPPGTSLRSSTRTRSNRWSSGSRSPRSRTGRRGARRA